MPSLKELSQTRADLAKQNQALLDKAAADDNRALTTEEASEWDKRDAEIDALGDQIDALTADETRRQRQQALAADLGRPLPRQTAPRGGDGHALEIDLGRAGKVTLKPGHPLYRSLAPRCDAKYDEAFGQYLLGDRRDFEALGLVTGDDSRGGYLAPMAFVSQMIKFVDDMSVVRGLATVLPPTNAKSVGAVSFDTDYADADWTPEVSASDISEDDTARFGSREMTPHGLSKLVKASNKLIRSSAIGIEAFVAQRIAYRFAITEEKAFLTGTGSQRPLGLFVASNDGIPTSRDVTASATTSFTADDLIDTKESLKDPYQRAADWLLHRDCRKRIRKLKDGNGQYLWAPGLQGQPDTLLERPIRSSEYAPNTFTTGQYVLVFGDFKFYWIQDSLALEVQRLNELFALKNQVGWVARRETDAMPVLSEAFARLKLA